jgi:hypothetical protein
MKRVRIIVIAVFVLLGGGLSVCLHQTREPRYQGRTLTEWLKLAGAAPDYSVTVREATNAVKRIGTNAIPFLLKKISTRDSRFKRRLMALIDRQSIFHFHLTDEDEEVWLGATGFFILGKDAVSAVPALGELAKSPDPGVSGIAFMCIEQMDPDKEIYLPVLLGLLSHSTKTLEMYARPRAAEILIYRFPEEVEKAGVYKIYPRMKPATTNAVSTNAAPELTWPVL